MLILQNLSKNSSNPTPDFQSTKSTVHKNMCTKMFTTVDTAAKNLEKTQSKGVRHLLCEIICSHLKAYRTSVPRLLNRERQFLQQIVLGKLDSYMQKNEVGFSPYTIDKNQLKNGLKEFLLWLSSNESN